VPKDSCSNSHRLEKTYRYISLYASHEGTWRSGGLASLILNIGTRWDEWLASRLGRFTVEERCPGTRAWVGPKSLSGRTTERRTTFRCPVRNLVSISTELSQISVTAVRTWNHSGISFEGNRKITTLIHVLPKFPSVPYNMSLGISPLLKHTHELF
jgi:hypothetical protein